MSLPDPHSAPDRIASVVLNWNGGSVTIRCVESLYCSTDVSVNVIVVDNGSTDGSLMLLRSRFPHVHVIANERNVGVAAGFNLGLEKALAEKCEFVFFINNDATVEPSTLSVLADLLHKNERVAIVTPRIMDGTRQGLMWYDGGARNLFGEMTHRGMGRMPDSARDNRLSAFATGCAMLVRASLFDSIGKFDEQFFAYAEDADFSLRTINAGREILHCPTALVIHLPSSSIKRNAGRWLRDYYVTRNNLILQRKHLKSFRWMLFLAYFTVKGIVGSSLYFLVTGQFKRIGATLSGARDFMMDRVGERKGE
jgi:GT2 family glycosyltransferase